MAEMTKKELLELLNEFSEKTLDPKFKQIDTRFIEFREDIIHQFHVISEDIISKVQLVRVIFSINLFSQERRNKDGGI
jgi:hypothetical protein